MAALKSIDGLRLLLRDNIEIVKDSLTVTQPTVGEVKDYGEEAYWSAVMSLTSIPSDSKSILADVNIDYATLDEFEYFITVTRTLDKTKTYPLLGDTDLSEMVPVIDRKTEKPVLINKETGFVIDRMVYELLVSAIRQMHGIEVKREKPMNKYTRMALIEEDRVKRAKAQSKPFTSLLLPQIATLLCTEEFKYDSFSVLNIGIYELTLTFKQIIKKKAALALTQGCYSGFVDTSKISKDAFDWLYHQPRI